MFELTFFGLGLGTCDLSLPLALSSMVLKISLLKV